MHLVPILAYLAVPILLLLVFIWRIRRRHFLKLAAKFPGPPAEFLLGHARQFGSGPRDMYVNIMRIWKEFGNLLGLWIGPFMYVVMADPKDIEVVITSNKYLNKSFIYKFLQPWLGTGLLTSTGQKWQKHRKIITPTFHFKILEQFVDVFNSNGNTLIKSLKKSANGKPVDIYDFITLYAIDVICETAMGVSVNAQQSSDSEYVTALRKQADLFMRRIIKPWFYSDIFFNISGNGKSQSDALNILHGMTNKVIQERKRQLFDVTSKSNGHVNNVEENGIGIKKRLAFLDLLLQAVKDGADLSDESIREEVDTFMFEGHDTTTSGICYTLWFLAKHQDVQEKSVQELQSIFGAQRDISPSYQNLGEMKYLECVIKESLRLCPSVPFIGRDINEDTPIKTGNLILPAGSSVLISPYLLHRNSDYYDEPEKFNPDRFLPENSQGRHPYAFIPFSAGPRNCIGQKFAMLELKATVAKILWHYHLSTEPEFEPVLTIELILKSVNGVNLKLLPRVK